MDGWILLLHFFGGSSTFYYYLVQQTGEHDLERRDPKPESQVYDIRSGWDRQTCVTDHKPVGVAEPGQSVCELRVYNAFLFHNFSTFSGVGSAPWAPSFVTAAAPAFTA